MTRGSLLNPRALRLLSAGRIFLFLVILWAISGLVLHGIPEETSGTDRGPAVILEIGGAIGPATDDYIGRSLEKAAELGAPVVIVHMNTPGGLDNSMRAIISKILDSPIPVAVYVAPEGARATSAGTYILYAAHVAAMAPGTHLGAATPVRMGGGQEPLDPDTDEGEAEETDDTDAAERKLISDAVAYIRSLAELRDRNAEWAERAVREGVSLTSSEALEMNVIEHLVPNVEALLEEMDGRTVRVRDEDRNLETSNLETKVIEPDWRTRLLSILTNPNIAYLLMLLGIYGLILEFANPGALVPGITGAICLLLGLFALQLLPVNYAGIALILLGLALMVAEAFAPSFGALGVGGAIAFIFGSIILIDTDVPGFELYRPLILAFAAISAFFLIVVLSMAMKAWKRPVVTGTEGFVGQSATALEDFDREGRVRLQGESWKARTTAPVKEGQTVKVTAVKDLLLTVEPEP